MWSITRRVLRVQYKSQYYYIERGKKKVAAKETHSKFNFKKKKKKINPIKNLCMYLEIDSHKIANANSKI